MTHVATGHDQVQLREARTKRLASRQIPLAGDQHDLMNARVGLEEVERVLEDGPPGNLHEDLVDASAHSCAQSSGHDDRGSAHCAGSARTRICATSQSPIMSVIRASFPATRARASTSASRSKTQGPVTWTSVSRGTVRRTLPPTTSLTVSLMEAVKTPTLPSPASGGGKVRAFASGGRFFGWMTTWSERGASRRASRRRATKPGPGSTVRTATSATGSAAARGPPQRFGPSHGRLAGRRGEDHPPGGGLQDGGHDHPDRLVHVAAPIFDHDHGAVIEVRDSLVLLLAFLDHLDVHFLAGNHDRLERVRQVVQVEDAHTLELRDAVQIVIVRHDGGIPLRCQLDQLHVDLGDLGNILVDELDGDDRLLLQQVEHLQPAPSAVSAQRVTGVGDVLQLGQHEVRYQDLVPKET